MGLSWGGKKSLNKLGLSGQYIPENLPPFSRAANSCMISGARAWQHIVLRLAHISCINRKDLSSEMVGTVSNKSHISFHSGRNLID